MRIAVRLLGLDLVEFTIETDAAESASGPGDCTATPTGFALPEVPPAFEVPDRSES